MDRRNDLIKKWGAGAIVALIALSVLCVSPHVSAADNDGKGIEISGRVTFISGDSIGVDKVQYPLSEGVVVYDMEEDEVPRFALEMAEEVKLEVSNGTVETIHILVRAE